MADDMSLGRRRIFHLISGGLLAYIILTGFGAWNRLPQRIPIHFGADGLPNRWTNDRSELLIFFLIPFFLTLMLYGFGALIPFFRRNPQWVNIPNKKKFLELPAERQEPFWACLQELFPTMAAAANLLLACAIRGTLEVALGKAERLPWWSVWPGLAVLLALVAVQMTRMIVITYRIKTRMS
jgi:hypothetical protein